MCPTTATPPKRARWRAAITTAMYSTPSPRRASRWHWHWPRLRGKVHQGLAQRFLIKHGTTVEMPFERLRGRIDSEGVVVDGQLVNWDDFIELLLTHEGWEFDLRIPLEPDW